MSEFAARFQQAAGSGATLVEAPETGDSLITFARSVAAGLADRPRWLHCRFLYDAEGSRLFEEITRQPEYYPTRTEAAILATAADEIRHITGPRTLVELGSGYSVKTEHLLSAYSSDGSEVHYVPVDVSVEALRQARDSIGEHFSRVRFTGINGTYASAFPVFAELSPQMVIFLGSTIGNFNEAEAHAFWTSVARHLPAGDFFLLGLDLVKDPATLEAAYDDAAGVTARFTRNYFARMNRELGAEIDLSQIEHVAVWNAERERVEIYAHFRSAQRIHIAPLDETVEIAAGERILMEISRKFRRPQVERQLARYGLEVRRTYTDDNDWFALLLLQRVAGPDAARGNPSETGR